MKTKVQLSFMMFVEWFIWGAWFVPLWLWLSKSGFTAGEIGWSYACTAIAAILSPILVGSLTDRFFAAQKVLAVLMFVGAVLMYLAAQQTTFAGFFPLLLAIKAYQIFRERHQPWQWSGLLFSWRLVGLIFLVLSGAALAHIHFHSASGLPAATWASRIVASGVPFQKRT